MKLTTCGKTIKCPYWNETVTLTGYYKIQDSTPELIFHRSTCPIIENSKLPVNQQNKNYLLMRCPYQIGCHFLNEFKEVVIPDVDGYSQ